MGNCFYIFCFESLHALFEVAHQHPSDSVTLFLWLSEPTILQHWSIQYRYQHTGWENEEMQMLSKYSYSGWKPNIFLHPFHQIICSFQLTRNNWSSRLTCSDRRASAESCLIPSQYGFTYGISASHLNLSARPPSDKMVCHHQISWVAVLPRLPAQSPGYFTSFPGWN